MIKIEDYVVTPTIFPDKTSQVWHLPDELLEKIYRENICTVIWEFESEAEFMHLAQLKSLLETYTKEIYLDMPYLPYGRQDKRVDNQSSFALTAFAHLLNSLMFTSISVLDAHNYNRTRMIDGLVNMTPRPYIAETLEILTPDVILFPDAGAQDRYDGYSFKAVASANKVRDQATGRITCVTLMGDVTGKSILIIDDLADGGMTFKLVAEAALKQGAKEVHLYVTHGIFSQGLQTLRDSGIKRIFTYKGEVL